MKRLRLAFAVSLLVWIAVATAIPTDAQVSPQTNIDCNWEDGNCCVCGGNSCCTTTRPPGDCYCTSQFTGGSGCDSCSSDGECLLEGDHLVCGTVLSDAALRKTFPFLADLYLHSDIAGKSQVPGIDALITQMQLFYLTRGIRGMKMHGQFLRTINGARVAAQLRSDENKVVTARFYVDLSPTLPTPHTANDFIKTAQPQETLIFTGKDWTIHVGDASGTEIAGNGPLNGWDGDHHVCATMLGDETLKKTFPFLTNLYLHSDVAAKSRVPGIDALITQMQLFYLTRGMCGTKMHGQFLQAINSARVAAQLSSDENKVVTARFYVDLSPTLPTPHTANDFIKTAQPQETLIFTGKDWTLHVGDASGTEIAGSGPLQPWVARSSCKQLAAKRKTAASLQLLGKKDD